MCGGIVVSEYPRGVRMEGQTGLGGISYHQCGRRPSAAGAQSGQIHTVACCLPRAAETSCSLEATSPGAQSAGIPTGQGSCDFPLVSSLNQEMITGSCGSDTFVLGSSRAAPKGLQSPDSCCENSQLHGAVNQFHNTPLSCIQEHVLWVQHDTLG